jgi:hypothetical protein
MSAAALQAVPFIPRVRYDFTNLLLGSGSAIFIMVFVGTLIQKERPVARFSRGIQFKKGAGKFSGGFPRYVQNQIA